MEDLVDCPGMEKECESGDFGHSGSEGDTRRMSVQSASDDFVDDLAKNLDALSTDARFPPPTYEEVYGSAAAGGCVEVEIECGSEQEQNYFDSVIGAIEDIVMSDDFHAIHTRCLEKYWSEFSEDQADNLHSHFEMFKEYSQAISTFIEERLKNILNNFDMELFVEQLGSRIGILDGEIFEMLFTLIDYVKFKELVLDYRAMKEGRNIDLSQGICVRAIQIEDEDDN